MTVLFRAKTKEGYTFKILADVLQNTIKTACLRIQSDGIFLRMLDSYRRILLDLVLHNHHFNSYEVHSSKPLFIGLNLNHLYQRLKGLKKKDSIVLSMDDEHPDDLCIDIYPKENSKFVRSYIHIQDTQMLAIPLPTGYGVPILVPSSEYQRSLKDMNNIHQELTIQMRRMSMTLSVTAENIYSSSVTFGELDEKDTTDVQYEDTFDMDQLIRILKISGLNKDLYIYSGSDDRPLWIQVPVGSLGMLNIYIKSISQTKRDSS
jgi:proliferating cell nuclear antigen PCNA